MDTLLSFVLSLVVIYIEICGGKCKDYCSFENFEPQCKNDEIILMTDAKYGQMELGKCIAKDLGYLGCQGDVLNILDRECSGKATCDVRVGSREMRSKSSCEDYLLQYLSATYACHNVLQIQPEDCQTNDIILPKQSVFISRNLLEQCLPVNKAIRFSAEPGQHVNISLIDMHDSLDESYGNRIFGKIKDSKTNIEKHFGSGNRYQHLITTTGNVAELTLMTNSEMFAIELDAHGCADMLPPDGAWMTRDGNVMEIGCHSGKHIWRLRCEDDQWVGAVGLCGTVIDKEEVLKITENQTKVTISTNILVFGACSVLLLISSIVFLIGVLLLKRHNNDKYDQYHKGQQAFLPITNDVMAFESLPRIQTAQDKPTHVEKWMSTSQDYKSLNTN